MVTVMEVTVREQTGTHKYNTFKGMKQCEVQYEAFVMFVFVATYREITIPAA